MKKLAMVAVAAFVVSAFVTPADAQVSFDGKAVSFHSNGPAPIPLPPAPAPILVGTITKGKKKTVLTADATLTSEVLAPGAPWTLSVGVDVNGISMDPSITPPFNVVQDCGSDSFGGLFVAPANGCTASGTFMIDIDAAELVAPGCCIGVPLVVTLTGGPAFNPGIAGIPTSATLAVRMEKKK